jgi:excisionase family DNA binding protein
MNLASYEKVWLMEKAIDPAAYFTAADVARELNVTPATVRAWETAGRIEAIRTRGGVRLFHPAEVKRLRVARAARDTRSSGRG